MLAAKKRMQLHTFIARAPTAFWGSPADIIERAFSLAGFTVDAVRLICRPDLVMDSLIDPCWTKGDAGTIKLRGAFL